MREFIKGVFSEADGTPSFGRVITVPLVAFVLGWDTAALHLTHMLPSEGILIAQAGFMTVFYGVNKVAGAYTIVRTTGAPAQGGSTDGKASGAAAGQ